MEVSNLRFISGFYFKNSRYCLSYTFVRIASRVRVPEYWRISDGASGWQMVEALPVFSLPFAHRYRHRSSAVTFRRADAICGLGLIGSRQSASPTRTLTYRITRLTDGLGSVQDSWPLGSRSLWRIPLIAPYVRPPIYVIDHSCWKLETNAEAIAFIHKTSACLRQREI